MLWVIKYEPICTMIFYLGFNFIVTIFFYSIKIRRPTLCSLAKVDKLLGEFVGKHYKLIA